MPLFFIFDVSFLSKIISRNNLFTSNATTFSTPKERDGFKMRTILHLILGCKTLLTNVMRDDY